MEKTKHGLILIVLCLLGNWAFSNPFIRLDPTRLAKTKAMIGNGTASVQTISAYHRLLDRADELLSCKNPNVMDKTLIPPSGDKHDYLSISRYWWPNTETEDGLPWVRSDGNTNPETQTDAVDRKRLGFMGKGVWQLSLAYYFTNDEKYAQKAIQMIETWFLQPETLMNPHLEYGQSVPGNPNRRATGILDGRSLVMFIPDAINLLSDSEYWSDGLQLNTTKWFSDYLLWLTQSKLGIKGSEQKNNHGSWYTFQVASLALYLGNEPLVRKMVESAEGRLDEMLDDEGGQRHELTRSRSFFYSCFNLQALTLIAVIADKIGMDMWHYESDGHKGLSLAINYLTPVVEGKEWPHKTLKPIDISDLVPVLALLPEAADYKPYKKVLSKILETMANDQEVDSLQEYWLLNHH